MHLTQQNVCFHILERVFLSSSSFTAARIQQEPKYIYKPYKGQITVQLNMTATAQLNQFKERPHNSTSAEETQHL